MPNIKVPTNFSAVYFCPTCAGMYKTEEAARKCFASTPPPSAAVSDVILLYPQYGWFDGDAAWVVDNTGIKHHDTPLYAFWYVISAITENERHQQVYHLRTNAMVSQGFSGWTTEHGHRWVWTKKNVRPPSKVLKEASAMLGYTFSHLI